MVCSWLLRVHSASMPTHMDVDKRRAVANPAEVLDINQEAKGDSVVAAFFGAGELRLV